MDFSHPIAIAIARPFALAKHMADRFVNPSSLRQRIIGLPVVGIHRRLRSGFGFDLRLERGPVAMMTDHQVQVLALPADDAGNRDAISVPGAVAPYLVGPTTRRIIRIFMFTSFLPGILIELIGFRNLIG